ncbi:MAG: TonB-dependent receptor [Vicingus serpentipes]|nr:TonB-dependent receptor [Vicingus serpentipes]
MKKIITCAISIASSLSCLAQFNISGTVKDSTLQNITGATIKVAETYKGVFTDNNGAYQLANVKPGQYVIEVSFIGYSSQKKDVTITDKDVELHFQIQQSTTSLGEVIVSSTRVEENAPFAHTNILKQDFEKNNLGQDIPILLQNSPSMVSTSDAGAGVGYTGFRLRGSDATRINVTINGIPVNDAESQGTYWVNMPDFASSTENIQIQRGVGSSTNGASAFGGSINLQTDNLNEKAYGSISASYGSFNTHKETVKFGTGLINKNWAFDGRISNVQSDGYIDRATSDLKSYYLSAGYYSKKTAIKAITFSGKEKTYQSWWGTPESRITGNKKEMETHATNNWLDDAQTYNLLNSGRTYNYYQYDNETDNYQQDHYQLHVSNQFNDKLNATMAFHYTYGRGYYEQFRKQDNFSSYGLSDLIINTDTITSSDIIRRRWLSNDFYGSTFNLNYKNTKVKLTFGGAYNIYDGDHYGEIIWAQFANESSIRDRYYDNNGLKKDFNSFLKATYSIASKTTIFGDLQIRTIDYKASGIDNNLGTIAVDTNFVFFNPKAGVNHQLNEKIRLYASFSVGNKEPSRNDFIDNPANKQPKHETLFDYEAGIDLKFKKILIQGNFYYMDYTNQLILTGELNDVGSSVRTNVAKSHRTGLELVSSFLISKKVKLNVNATYSQNKINDFTEILYDYTTGFDIIENKYKNTDIAFSPNVIAAAAIEYNPFKGINLMLQTKYVGDQFLDNTSNANRKIDAYQTIDARLSYSIFPKRLKEISFNFLANNILNTLYSSNGYTYSYIVGEIITENFYYPQAGTNFLVGMTVKF